MDRYYLRNYFLRGFLCTASSLSSGTNKFPLIKGCDISTWNRIGNRCIVTDVSSLFQVFLYSVSENAFSSDAILCEILHVRVAWSTFPSNFSLKSLPRWFFPRVFNGWKESQIYVGLSTIKNKNDATPWNGWRRLIMIRLYLNKAVTF